jgi:pyruvate/2-oxoacid:ferredoxin oxidoreductase beta subunit
MAMDSSIQVCRQAVRTNYFPLWESENGSYRITQPVKKPKPVSELTKLIGKFKHADDEQLAVLQSQVDKRFNVLNSLCEGTAV